MKSFNDMLGRKHHSRNGAKVPYQRKSPNRSFSALHNIVKGGHGFIFSSCGALVTSFFWNFSSLLLMMDCWS
jgi:hypothetical protein